MHTSSHNVSFATIFCDPAQWTEPSAVLSLQFLLLFCVAPFLFAPFHSDFFLSTIKHKHTTDACVSVCCVLQRTKRFIIMTGHVVFVCVCDRFCSALLGMVVRCASFTGYLIISVNFGEKEHFQMPATLCTLCACVQSLVWSDVYACVWAFVRCILDASRTPHICMTMCLWNAASNAKRTLCL